MVVKALHVKQGDLLGTGTEFIRIASKNRPGRSQSVHSSVEAG